jgi:4-hydroxybenzoate polyprenyltransferase/SAM-dependent methyltransferase
VCGSTAVQPWKSHRVQHHLEPGDLHITDGRYGLTLTLVRCESCGFRFADDPNVGRLTALYGELDDPGYEASEESRALQMRWLVSLVRDVRPDARSALDVGAASGLLVAEAVRQGFEAIGVEPSRKLAAEARERHGVEVLAGVLPHPALAGRRFDVIFLVDVIEHVADPAAIVRQCRAHLADDGVLLVVTPDAGSVAARALGSRWWHYRLAHVGYFERRSLDMLLRAEGLTVRRRKRAKWFFSVDYLATRAEAYLPVAGFNRFARRNPALGWLYRRVIPLNLFDSFAWLAATGDEPAPRPTLRGHLEICRVGHWSKNVFVLPGIVVAAAVGGVPFDLELVLRTLIGLLATGLVASSNYVLNELLDAESDRHHPDKCTRAVPSGRVHPGLAYLQWIVLAVAGVALGWQVSASLAAVLAVLWIMGCVYNVPPLRTKDVPYLDVLSEAVNNPLRMLAGWFIVAPDAVAPASLLMSYWMVGAYFMAMKRFAEWRHIANPARAGSYRRAFRHYDETTLLVSVMFYASASMLFLGAFIMRYRLSLILSVPFVALVMALYLKLGLQEDSPVQRPETLYRQKGLVAAIVVCALVMLVCMFVELPWLVRLFAPLAPTSPAYSGLTASMSS